MNKIGDRIYNDYISSGLWKCDKSPTGAHHWICEENILVCKFCDIVKDRDDRTLSKIRWEETRANKNSELQRTGHKK